MNLDLLINSLASDVKRLPKNSYLSILLEAGHYSPRTPLSSFSLESFRDSLLLAKKLKYVFKRRVKIVLGVLVDDLGLVCSFQSCTDSSHSRTTEKLPIEYLDLIKEHQVKLTHDIRIASERNLKNRAISYLRKNKSELASRNSFSIKKSGEESIYYFNNELLGTSEKSRYTIRCPYLMGFHYKTCFEYLLKTFPSSQEVRIIDWSLLHQKEKVLNGRKVYSKLLMKTAPSKPNAIINIFSNEDYTIYTMIDSQFEQISQDFFISSFEEEKYANLFGL